MCGLKLSTRADPPPPSAKLHRARLDREESVEAEVARIDRGPPPFGSRRSRDAMRRLKENRTEMRLEKKWRNNACTRLYASKMRATEREKVTSQGTSRTASSSLTTWQHLSFEGEGAGRPSSEDRVFGVGSLSAADCAPSKKSSFYMYFVRPAIMMSRC